jgi:hypothetical protein
MAYQRIETNNQRFDGFFEYVDGNVIEGVVEEVFIKGKTDNGKETGLVAIRLIAPCKASSKKVPFDAEPDQLICLSITAATRVLIGCEGKQVRCTFVGFKQTEKGKYHNWQIEIDDGL